MTLRPSNNIQVIIAEIHGRIRIENITTSDSRSLPTSYKIAKGEKITIQTTDKNLLKLIEKSI